MNDQRITPTALMVLLLCSGCSKMAKSDLPESAAVLVTDIDGNVYSTVVIGTQRWMSGNLAATRYCDGSDIHHEPDMFEWRNLDSGAYALYDNGMFGEGYGRLYNWFAANDARGLCPCGWHVPTDAEWRALESTLGIPSEQLEQVGGFRGGAENAGGKMKLPGTEPGLWLPPNAGATNASGFNARPGGMRWGQTGIFVTLREYGHWWTATQADPTKALSRSLHYQEAGVLNASNDKRIGMSIRCVQD